MVQASEITQALGNAKVAAAIYRDMRARTFSAAVQLGARAEGWDVNDIARLQEKCSVGNEKGQPLGWPNSLISLVGARGFEPPTPCTPCTYATRLRYAPTSQQL